MTDWKTVSEEKQAYLLKAIPEEWIIPGIAQSMKESGFINTHDYLETVLPESERGLTNLSATELAAKIRSEEVSSYAVCYAFCHRAALAHQLLNCCAEIFFDKALARAQQLDDILKKTKQTVGPLHGIPVSLKDQVNLPGLDTAIGYVSLAGKKATHKSLLAKILEDSGAVFYVKTTVPTAMIASETISNLHGYTFNAINMSFTSGGSSGGEGALIGAGGSVLGVGTDIAGSIRIPASFQGLYGLKPSYGRIPYMHISNSYAGQEVMPSVIGPMATSIADVELFTKTVIRAETWEYDPNVIPIPWRDMSFLKTKKLRFGILWTDNLIKPHPPILRALKKTVNDLRLKGHEVIEWSFPYQKQVLELANRVLGADEGYEVKMLSQKSGEPFVDCLKYAFPKIDIESIDLNPISVNEWWKLAETKTNLKERFLQHWRETANQTSDGHQIDAIISPVWPSAGFEPGSVSVDPINYTVPVNVLDCTSVVFPITLADKDIDKIELDYIPVDDIDEAVQNYYKPQKFDKMPVCIQIVCKRLEEEKALAIASVVSECLL